MSSSIIYAAAPGDLDLTFGNAGVALTPIGRGEAKALAAVVQPDDKIVAAGRTYNGANWDIALVRYNADGTLDSSFGSGGAVVSTYLTNGTNSDEEAYAVALQPDGKIVVGGYVIKVYSYSGARRYYAVLRYNANGTLDASFGSGGKVFTEVSYPGYQYSNSTCYAIVVQPDGKIVAVGTTNFNAGFGPSHAVARYNSDGSLDTSFGSGGITYVNISTQAANYGYGAALQSSGEIVVGGAYNSYQNYDFSATRLNPNGGYLDSFTTTHFYDTADDYAYAVAVQPDDKIILAGSTSFSGSPTSYSDYALSRYNADGSLDTSFGNLGKVKTGIGGIEAAFSVTLQRDDKIIAAGYSVIGATNDFSLARYNPNGSLDLTFGNRGIVTTAIGSSNEVIYSVKTQSDGKIIAVGTSYIGSRYQFAVARYQN